MSKTVTSNILGTLDNDLIEDIPGDTVIDAKASNDAIVGDFGDGNDIINAGNGDDSALGGDGNDRILGGSGTDFIRGGAGNDRLDGGTETDTLIGEDGDDIISSGDGNDIIYGDRIDFGGTGHNILKGGAGDDQVIGADGNDLIFGGDGKDIIDGALGNDTAYGGVDNDLVFGCIGDDQVYGGGGDDLVNGGAGNDRVFGGKGNDTLLGLSVSSFELNLGKGEVDTLTDRARNDTFVLGAIIPDGTRSVFYNDDASTAGIGDYALIADFDTCGRLTGSRDIIQLNGSADNYSLSAAPTGLPSATGIFYNNGATPELIAIVAGLSPSDPVLLTRNSSRSFSGQDCVCIVIQCDGAIVFSKFSLWGTLNFKMRLPTMPNAGASKRSLSSLRLATSV